MITIRKATAADHTSIAACLLLAMEEIVYRFLGVRDPQEAKRFMEHFTGRTGNQYSYRYCWVAEEDGQLLGASNVYDGARLHELRRPVIEHLKTHFGRELKPEDETGPGEYYIDCIGVLPAHQGRGIGSLLLRFMIDELVFKRGKTLGLLVDSDNPPARRLYLRLGFRSMSFKTLMGKQLEHLRLQPGPNDSGNSPDQ